MSPLWLKYGPKVVTHSLAFAAGLFLGWFVYRAKPGPVETPAAAVRQADSSLVLQRAPDAHAKLGMIVPKGDKPVRVAQVISQVRPVLNVVSNSPQPATATVHDTVSSVSGTIVSNPTLLSTYGADSGKKVTVTCPPDTIDLALVRQTDHTERVIAKSRNGQIVGGVDIPMEHVTIPRAVAWAAGPIYNVGAGGWGGAVTREAGPLRLLGAVTQQKGGGAAFLVGAMVRF